MNYLLCGSQSESDLRTTELWETVDDSNMTKGNNDDDDDDVA